MLGHHSDDRRMCHVSSSRAASLELGHNTGPTRHGGFGSSGRRFSFCHSPSDHEFWSTTNSQTHQLDTRLGSGPEALCGIPVGLQSGQVACELPPRVRFRAAARCHPRGSPIRSFYIRSPRRRRDPWHIHARHAANCHALSPKHGLGTCWSRQRSHWHVGTTLHTRRPARRRSDPRLQQPEQERQQGRRSLALSGHMEQGWHADDGSLEKHRAGRRWRQHRVLADIWSSTWLALQHLLRAAPSLSAGEQPMSARVGDFTGRPRMDIPRTPAYRGCAARHQLRLRCARGAGGHAHNPR